MRDERNFISDGISYTDPDILFGTQNEDGEIVYASKFDHDRRSWDFFETQDRQFWESLGVFSAADFDSMKNGVSLHNADVGDYAKHFGRERLTDEEEESVKAMLRQCLDVNNDPVVATVHIGDKLALAEREKMALSVERNPEVMELFVKGHGVKMLKIRRIKSTLSKSNSPTNRPTGIKKQDIENLDALNICQYGGVERI